MTARFLLDTSIVVGAELRYGARNKGSTRLTSQLEAILGVMEVMPFEAPADAIYAQVREALEAAGTPIGGNDLLIAAQALALEMIVVTANAGEFKRVRGLKVENWLK